MTSTTGPSELPSLISEVLTTEGWQVHTCSRLPRAGLAIGARRGRAKISVELPTVGTTFGEVLKRHNEQHRAGIRCLWLLPFATFPIRDDLPAFCVVQQPEGFVALLPSGGVRAEARSSSRLSDWAQVLPLPAFLRAALTGRLWFGVVRRGQPAIVRLDGGFTKCTVCRGWTNLCHAIEVISTYPESSFAFYKLQDIPPYLLPDLVPSGLGALKVGKIQGRYQREEGRSIARNSCFQCNALIEQESLIEISSRVQPITQVSIIVSNRLASAAGKLPTARWRLSL